MLKFKNIFKTVTHYSMPTSILFIFSKRLNLIINSLIFFLILVFSFL